MSAGAALADTERGEGDNKPRRRARGWVPYLLLIPGLIWLAIFFIFPMLTLVNTSLQSGSPTTGYTQTLSFSNYSDAIWQYRSQFLRSFYYAGVATLLTLAISYPLAYTIAFKSGRWKNFLLVLVIAPFFTSFLIRTLAWRNILGDEGPVTSFVVNTHIIDLLDLLGLTTGDRLLATPLAVMLGLTYNFLPFMTLPLFASLDRLDPRLIEAAGDLYCSPWAGFRKVTFPLSLPGVVAGTLLTFIPAAGDFINAQLLGTPKQAMIGNVIDSQFFRVRDYPTAAALSVTLMLTIVVLVWLYVRRAGTEELV